MKPPDCREDRHMARVLVVLHDPATRRLLALHLESETHDVLTAEDGEQGLQMAIDSHPDLIVSDFRMPRIDGIGMLKGIRADARTAAIPFIFLTDAEDQGLRVRSSALRVAEYLVKPFDRDCLLEAVSRQARKRGVRPQRHYELAPAMQDQTETMAMAPEYAMPTPDIDTPVRDATTRAVDGTVSFFAIRDFGRIGEAIGDDLQIELINAFYEHVRDVVAKNSGWIVKTIEGGFIAIFEDGVTNPVHHAERATKTAMLCVLALHRFGPWIAAQLGHRNIPALAAVAGLHSGQVSVCSLRGGKAGGRSERTIIGDTVNVASRLQAKAGELGWGIVCSDETLRKAGPRFGKGRKEQIVVKGRKTPLNIVEATGLRPRPGESGDAAFYAEFTNAMSANTRLIGAQNSIRQPETATAPRAPVAPVAPVATPAPAAAPLTSAPPAAPVPPLTSAPPVKFTQSAGPDATLIITASEPPADAPIAVHGYQVLRKIGEGGVAQVYLARHASSGDLRVLKMVRLSEENDSETAKRFVQEYALLMQITHQNVAQAYQHGHAGVYAYMAMEYFPGGDLRSLMRQACAPPMAVAALIQIASGITAVHRTGVVHRDLKPDNIMIRDDGSLAIADFGIARRIGGVLGPTQHGDIIGTPYYLSPEQVQGLPADHRSDIYSLGVMFYEMLAGERAYVAETAMALMHQHVNSPVPRLREALKRYQPLLERMMNKDKDRRFGGASEIVDFVTHYRLA